MLPLHTYICSQLHTVVSFLTIKYPGSYLGTWVLLRTFVGPWLLLDEPTTSIVGHMIELLLLDRAGMYISVF